MPDLADIFYVIAIVGGTAVLGGGIAYGYLRWRSRTPAERQQAERGAHDIYERDGREAR